MATNENVTVVHFEVHFQVSVGYYVREGMGFHKSAIETLEMVSTSLWLPWKPQVVVVTKFFLGFHTEIMRM